MSKSNTTFEAFFSNRNENFVFLVNPQNSILYYSYENMHGELLLHVFMGVISYGSEKISVKVKSQTLSLI